MEGSEKGIFLLFEGLPKTIIESQVLSMVKLLGEQGIEMEVWAFAMTNASYKEGLVDLPRYMNQYNFKIRLYRGFRSIIPFSCFLNATLFLLLCHINGMRPSFVRGRTEYSTAVAAIAKSVMGFNLLWDSRGDTYSEYEERIKEIPICMRWLSFMKLRSIKKRLVKVGAKCDRAVFVSDELMKLQGKRICSKNKFVVPCLASENDFYFDVSLRDSMRRKLGYKVGDVVMVYAGSTAVWQSVSETISLMSKVIKRDSRFKGLIISPELEHFNSIIPPTMEDSFKVISCTLGEMNKFLNASDISIFLRKEGRMSWVSSPIKFAEYSMTGLMVASSDTVSQVNGIGRSLGNLVEPTEDSIILISNHLNNEKRAIRANTAINICGREENLQKLINIHSFHS